MKYLKLVLIFILVSLFFQNCATLISRSIYPFTIETNPEDANVTVINSKGKEIYNGLPPTKLALRSGSGFFKKESYLVTISKKGFESQTFPITCKIDTWYLGNILFIPSTGLVGLLILDPLTGAMYRLQDDFKKIELEKTKPPVSINHVEIKIYELDKIPEEWKNYLVKINL